jgi:hypothetical protein
VRIDRVHLRGHRAPRFLPRSRESGRPRKRVAARVFEIGTGLLAHILNDRLHCETRLPGPELIAEPSADTNSGLTLPAACPVDVPRGETGIVSRKLYVD